MTIELAPFARRVAEAQRKRDGFQALQRTKAGPIEVTAHVRTRPPNLLAVEFRSFANPLLDLEEQLLNGAEFSPDELKAMSFFTSGGETIAYDPAADVAIHRPGFAMPEPLPGFRSLGVIGFLDRLTVDYLLRDETSDEDAKLGARRIGIKPKEQVRSELLSVTSFPFRRATLRIDEETLFPHRIEFVPSAETLLASLLGGRGSSESVSIEFTDVRLDPPDPAAFEFQPPESARVFHEHVVPLDAITDRSPFVCRLDPLTLKGYRAEEAGCRLVEDSENGRGYLHAVLNLHSTDGTESTMTVRAGNYLSRNMSRRRATLAERGEQIDLGAQPGRLLDRKADWPEAVSPIDRALQEVSWEVEGTYWFLLGEGVDRDQLIDLARDLVLVSS